MEAVFGQGALQKGAAVFGAVQQDGDAVFRLLDALERFGQRPGVVGVGLQKVHGAKRLVHAHQGFFGGGGVALDQGKVGVAVEFVHVNMLAEVAPRGVDQGVAHFFEQAFGAAAVFDEIGDGADFEVVFGGEFF